MYTHRGFISLGMLVAIVVVAMLVGGSAYYIASTQLTTSYTLEDRGSISTSTPLPQTDTMAVLPKEKTQIQNSTTQDIEIVSVRHPSITYRINNTKDDNTWLRIVDVSSGIPVWSKAEVVLGTHEMNLLSLDLPYEKQKTSLAPGTYHLELATFISGTETRLAKSANFTVPGTAIPLPTCTINITTSAPNASTFTWTSQNATEAYFASVPAKGGNAIMFTLKNGRSVSLNGSEVVDVSAQDFSYGLVVKNARGATYCSSDGTRFFSPQSEIDNPPTMG